MTRKLLLLLCLASPSWAGIAISTWTAGFSHNPTTPAIDTHLANLLVVGESCATINPCNAPTDSLSNTWHRVALIPQGGVAGGTAEVWYAYNATVGVAQTFTGDTNVYGLTVEAFSGVQSASDPLDQKTSQEAPRSNSYQGAGITPSGDGYLVISYIGGSDDTSAWGVDSGLTITNSGTLVGGVSYGQGLAYYIQPTAAAINPTWSFSSGPFDVGLTNASFKIAPPAAPYNPVKGMAIEGVKVNMTGSKIIIQ